MAACFRRSGAVRRRRAVRPTILLLAAAVTPPVCCVNKSKTNNDPERRRAAKTIFKARRVVSTRHAANLHESGKISPSPPPSPLPLHPPALFVSRSTSTLDTYSLHPSRWMKLRVCADTRRPVMSPQSEIFMVYDARTHTRTHVYTHTHTCARINQGKIGHCCD